MHYFVLFTFEKLFFLNFFFIIQSALKTLFLSLPLSPLVPLPVILDLDDLNVTIGLNITLNCTASGFGLRYEWDPRPCGNGCTIQGFESQLLSLGPVLFGSAGEYVCNVTDFIGQTVTKIINITPLGK